MIHLRKATNNQGVLIGPFVGDTDGRTPMTTLAVSAADIRLSANGGVQAAKNAGGAAHSANGWYTLSLDSVDTAACGRLQLTVNKAGALPVRLDCMVLDQDVYDSLVLGSRDLPVDTAAIQASLDAIQSSVSSGAAVSNSPVSASGTTTLVRDRTYKTDAGARQLDMTVSGIDLTGSAVDIRDTWSPYTVVPGVCADKGASTQHLVFEIDNSVTATLRPGTRRWEIVATYGAEPVHVAFVTVTVV